MIFLDFFAQLQTLVVVGTLVIVGFCSVGSLSLAFNAQESHVTIDASLLTYSYNQILNLENVYL